jgi:hypothetical protein
MDTVIESQAATISERPGRAYNGVRAAALMIAVVLIALVLVLMGTWFTAIGAVTIGAVVVSAFGLYMLQPNQAARSTTTFTTS